MTIIPDISHVTLDTPRLRLRPWLESDLEDFHAYASQPGVGEMAGWLPHTSRLETLRVLSNFLRNKNVFALENKETGHVIGSFGMHSSFAEEDCAYAGLRFVEIGYVLSPQYWGKGLMPEAVEAVLPWLFEEVALDMVTVSHFSENDRSRRVIEKCGFTPVSRHIRWNKHLGQEKECVEYIYTRADWEARRFQ